VSELDLLFLVLAALYGWECTCWVRHGSVVFRSWLGRQWRALLPGALLGNQRGGLVFAPPLPPLGTLLLGQPFPLSFSSESVLAYVTPAFSPVAQPVQTRALFPFSEIKTIEAHGRSVRVNGKRLLSTASPTFAAHLSQILKQLQQLSPDKREPAFRQLIRESLDVKAAERRWQEFQKKTTGIRLVANALFLYVFVAAPIWISRFGLRSSWPVLLTVLLALTSTTAILFYRAHKHFYPAAGDDRFTHFLILLLAPASAVRARDHLSRPLLENFHPLAPAKLLCPEPVFRALARNCLVDLRYPAMSLSPLPEPVAQSAERQARLAWQTAIEDFLTQCGLQPDDLLRPPAPGDDTCRSYCPRCQAQFTAGTDHCDDCGGLSLLPLSALNPPFRPPDARPCTLDSADD
jgi:hypothetical protein